MVENKFLCTILDPSPIKRLILPKLTEVITNKVYRSVFDSRLTCISVGKKKKKNRFTSRNKTAPSPYDDDIADSDHTSGSSDRQTYGTSRGPSTPPQMRSSFRASRSPRLAPMEEQENELDNHCKCTILI